MARALTVLLAGCTTVATPLPRAPDSPPPYQLGELEARAAALLFVGNVVADDFTSLQATSDVPIDVRGLELAARIDETAQARVTHADADWTAEIDTDCWTYKLTLAPGERSFRLRTIAASQRCADPPVSRPPPVAVPPGTLEKIRSAGVALITPDDETLARLPAGTKDRYVGSWKVCIDKTGTVTLTRRLRSTGLPAYDATIEREIARWKFEPWLLNDKPTPACASPTIVYARP